MIFIKNIEEYNLNKNKKKLTIFDDMIADKLVKKISFNSK